ncbi:MAG: PIN domain-containing protein [Edaphocola sp.]
MNGINYVVDTNCFIYFLDANPVLLPFAEEGWAFSYISEIELLSKKDISGNEENIVRQMLSLCYKVNHSQALTELTIMLKRRHTIKLPDAVVAATSLLLQLPLITADKSFQKIKEINCILLQP